MVGYNASQEYQLSQIWYGVAGVLSGVTTRFCCQPLDVLKIRFQLQHEPLRASKDNYYWSLKQALLRILKEESISAMWKGHVPAQMLSGVYGLMQFSTFEFLTKLMHQRYNDEALQHKMIVHFLCGSVSGATATLTTMPFDTIRTRLVGQGEPKIYKGVIHAFVTMSRVEGIFSLYKGLSPTLVQIIPHAGIQFSSFELLSQMYAHLTDRGIVHEVQNASKKLPVIGNLICGSSAGIIAKVCVYPLDLIKKRLQVQGFEIARKQFGEVRQYKGICDCLKTTVKTEGVSGLYKGLLPSLVKAVATTGLTFTLYEEISNLFIQLRL